MFLRFKNYMMLLMAAFFLSACGEYQRVLKSTDLDFKLQKAQQYYDQGRYAQAFPLFDELMTLYRGTQKAQDVYFYYAMTQYKMGDYLLAAYHFKNFYQTFPNNPYAPEAAFMVGFAYYKDSPTYSLDQANTYKAMNELQLFVNTHPGSEHTEECNQLIDEMRAKLQRKSYEIARQYWKTSYYKAAVESFNISMSNFPDTPYREEMMYLKLDSSFKLAKNSIVDLQPQRFKETQTAYYDLIDRFPETSYRKSADRIFQDTVEEIEYLKTEYEELFN